MEQLHQLASDINAQATQFPCSMCVVGGDWNLDPRSMSGARTSNERHDYLNNFEQNNNLVLKIDSKWDNSDETPATTVGRTRCPRRSTTRLSTVRSFIGVGRVHHCEGALGANEVGPSTCTSGTASQRIIHLGRASSVDTAAQMAKQRRMERPRQGRGIIEEALQHSKAAKGIHEALAQVVQRRPEPPRGRHPEAELDEEARGALLEKKAEELRGAAHDAPADARPRLGRALWRVRLRKAKIRRAARLRATGQGVGGGRRG